MVQIVIKRDGRTVPFQANRIEEAILKAFFSIDNVIDEYAQTKAANIASYIQNLQTEKLTVEEIQNYVEKGLMSTKRKDVARAYIAYREARTRIRNRKDKMRKTIDEKLSASNVQNQNANVDEESFGGREGEAIGEVLSEIALDEMSEMSRNNHLNNEIYIHDRSKYKLGMHNCLTLPVDPLLKNGFNTRQGDVRGANSVSTAFQLLVVAFQCQSLEQFGGVSASHLDWSMVPYVRKSFFKHWRDGHKYLLNDVDSDNLVFFDYKEITDPYYNMNDKVYRYAMDLTIRQVEQAAEGMFHNLNTLQSRSGSQLPFTSINFGTCTLPEGRMITKALLEAQIKGMGKLHKTYIFPCTIFQMMTGVNRHEGDPNYDLYKLAIECTSKRLYPNYANVDWSGNAGYDKNDPRTYFATMGCRTANGFDINGFGQLKDGRGNICPVTIILPTLAMEAREQANLLSDKADDPIVETFMKLLEQKICEAKDMLLERFDYICSQSAAAAKFMYENNTMAGYIPEEGIRSALKHGTLAIGQIGLAETLQALIGCDHTTDEGMVLARSIESLFADMCKKFKEYYHLNFGVYYTPAQNLCYTSMQKFKAKYGEIPNVSDREYFTNSMHVPVWYHMSPFDKIDIESQLTGYSSAGCITYIEADEIVREKPYAIQACVDYAMDHDIPYFAINFALDTCQECGYTATIEEDECPKCGCHRIQRLRRVTGYLTGDYKTAFNKGKQKETQDRVKHLK